MLCDFHEISKNEFSKHIALNISTFEKVLIFWRLSYIIIIVEFIIREYKKEKDKHKLVHSDTGFLNVCKPHSLQNSFYYVTQVE